MSTQTRSGKDISVPDSAEPDPGAGNSADDEQSRTDSARRTTVDTADSRDDYPVRTPTRYGRRWWVLCSVLLVAIIVAACWGFLSHRDEQQTLQRGADLATVEKAAADGAIAILSYKPQTVDNDLAGAKKLLTGDFLDYYSRFTRDVVAPSSKDKQIATTATVPAAAVESLAGDKAVVLVMVNQQTTSADNPQPAQSASSVRVQLSRRDGTWLIEKFDPV